MCQNEPYRMLKDWSYENEAERLEKDEPTATAARATPELTDVSMQVFFCFI